jgi:hypothetical protein
MFEEMIDRGCGRWRFVLRDSRLSANTPGEDGSKDNATFKVRTTV